MSAVGEDSYDLSVIGGGLIGLATARAYLVRRPGARVAVLEKEPELARHQSGRNSGVVHAGLYYPPGSLKARLCREGRRALLGFADERSIPYVMRGKLVVAVAEDELRRLEELARRGRANGLDGLRELEAGELREIEPHAAGIRALHVPETAVIDFRRVAEALAEEVRRTGGAVLLGHEVASLEERGSRRVLVTRGGHTVEAAFVVACAGLQADRVAGLTAPSSSEVRITPFRGSFYTLAPAARGLVNGLIYPVPDPAFPFLGVHFTRRIDGEVWAGPNAVPAFAREGYRRLSVNVGDARDLLGFPGMRRLARAYFRTGAAELWRDVVKRAAVEQMRRYLPELQTRDVSYGRSGVRAQVLRRDGSLVDDFLIERHRSTLHVLNAPSPAATACLAIGDWVAREAIAAA
jgi:L-2-hydroxyglutarate oxidase LhgO